MVKHGFIIGWIIAWVLVSYWMKFIEQKVSLWWSIAFFFAGLFFGTIVQTLMDKAEAKRLAELEEEKIEHRY